MGHKNISLVKRLTKDHHDLAKKIEESDQLADIELAESLRPTLKRALASLKALYKDDEVWKAAAEAVTVVKVPTRQLVQLAPNYRVSLPALLELFGYVKPPPAAQLVNDGVRALLAAPVDESPAERVRAVNETREALGRLLDRTLHLETEQPWQLPIIASETMPMLNAGITVAAGALTGGVAAAIGAAVVPAAIATGGLVLAPLLIMGGICRLKRNQKMRERDAQLLKARKQLTLDLVPAARAAVLQHLDAIAKLAQCTVESAQALLDLSDHLQALIDITRLFGVTNLHLRVEAQREIRDGGSAFNTLVLMQMPEVSAAARAAKASLDANGQIGQQTLTELERRLKDITKLEP
jgi:hypothetical protein